MSEDRFIIRDCLWLLVQPTGVPVYDFDFRRYFDCRTPYDYDPAAGLPGVARVGALEDYAAFYEGCLEAGIRLVHSPADHERCSLLPHWYPLLSAAHTPRSVWYEEIPGFRELTEEFSLPVFIKGARQTSRHQAAASIIRTAADYEAAAAHFRSDPILKWQQLVCREFRPLRPVGGGQEGKIPASFEFRTFWWRGQLVGAGRYWLEAAVYDWSPLEREEALAVARLAVAALDCVFLVVDLAQTVQGQWIVIECNDGMESGYAGVSPFALWQAIVDLERARWEATAAAG